MATALAFIGWDSYSKAHDGRGFFASDPLTFNSNQERLHTLRPGDALFLVSRAPDNQQYYFVGSLHIASLKRNQIGEPPRDWGEFAIVAERAASMDLGRRFPAEGLLRAFQFEKRNPIKHGASIGQSLQTLRVISPNDERVLRYTLGRLLRDEGAPLDEPVGLWTKCLPVFAKYFESNWRERRQPVAFLLYESVPTLPIGAPIFIHSDKCLRLAATFRGAEFVAGHKKTVEPEERISERERIWKSCRESTLNPPSKEEFDEFWEDQNGVRSLFWMDNVTPLPALLKFAVYGSALEWGYPLNVGHRHLSLSQCTLLLRGSELSDEAASFYLSFLGWPPD